MATPTAADELESVQYAIYSDGITLLSSPPLPGLHSSPSELLYELRDAIIHHVQPLVEDYIWQHQGFNLEVLKSKGGLWHLAGSTKFGDNVEDEWFIVFLLKTATEKFRDISITVRDNDGEFLLIEAAYVIPRWLKPENSLNRVFLREGLVHLVRRGPGEKSGNLEVEEAVALMRNGGGVTKATEDVQEAIARRIMGYPEQARGNMHKARCVVPLPVAQVLRHEPQMVSLAVDAFYRRDVDAMKAAIKLEKFLPVQDGSSRSSGDMVEVLVTMSRAMYAQLHQQTFAAPRKYPIPGVADPSFKAAELGMKLTCGFEMMYWERQRFEGDGVDTSNEPEYLKQEDKAPVYDPGWKAYIKRLEKSGYFRDLLEGSREWKQLLQTAIADYRRTQSFAAASADMQAPIKRVKEILSLPPSSADFSGSLLAESDSDAWLYDGECDLTNAINERQAEIDAHESRRTKRPNQAGSAGGGDDEAQPAVVADEPLYDPDELIQGIQSFMNKISSYEGAEFPGDEAVSLNISKFMEELESALGTSKATDVKDSYDDSDWDTEPDEDDDDDDDEDMADDDDEELRASSSLGNPAGVSQVVRSSKSSDNFMEEYSEALQHELQGSSLAKSFEIPEVKDGPVKTNDQLQQKERDDDNDGIVDVDINLVTSLLQSFMNQEGMPGPASNLLGAMGIKLKDPSSMKPDSNGK